MLAYRSSTLSALAASSWLVGAVVREERRDDAPAEDAVKPHEDVEPRFARVDSRAKAAHDSDYRVQSDMYGGLIRDDSRGSETAGTGVWE